MQARTNPAPSRREPPSTRPTDEGHRLVATLLEELDSFKGSRRFHEMGFGRGGEFYEWLERAEAGHRNNRYSLAERVALGDLITMAMDYMKSGGAETDATRYLRESVEAVAK